MKIYCVLFDTMPLAGEVVSVAEDNNGVELLRQVGGCFTTTTCVEMLTGKLPSDLEENGIGYELCGKYRDPVSGNIYWPWENQMLVYRLRAQNWQIRLHNGNWFSGQFLNNNPNAAVMSTAFPGGLEAESRKTWGDETISEIMLGDGPESEQFYQDEIQNIYQMQSEKPLKDTFYFVKYDQFHVATLQGSGKQIAASRLIELMRKWDFNEPDAMFWFFSDHGDWNTMTEHPDPNHYLLWALFKDNTAGAIKARSKFVSARDFFPTVMNKFGYSYESMPDVRSVQENQDKDRIYYTEDGRERFDKNNSTTAIACRFTDWQGDKPSRLHQVSYFKLRNEYKSFVSDIDENGFIINCTEVGGIDPVMKQAVIDRFHWIGEQSSGSAESSDRVQSEVKSVPKVKQQSLPRNDLVGLIFSKDRVMQLRATIESFLLHCKDSNDVRLTVLYKASTPLHQHQYDDLKNCFGGITFIEEEDFKRQTLAAIKGSQYILFMVDDNIFTRDFSIRDAMDSLQRETDAIGFSLRLGENTSYCYMADTKQRQPQFQKVTDSIMKYDWTRAEHDYGYPLEVSSSIYRSQQIADFLSGLDFENPNTMESQMLDENKQFKQNHPKLLCYRTSVTFCNPLNKVQKVYPQTRCGTDKRYTDERLAEIYQQGMVVDASKYADFVSNGVHQETELYFRKVADDAIKISVIVPCYNQGRFLPEAIGSLVNQTYTNWQCIIVNDGSSDNTAEVAKQLIAKYPDRDIRFIDKPHSGVSDTRNIGIEAADSEWILPLDSDDMFEPTFMRKAVDIIQQPEKVDIVFANMQEFGASNGEWIPAEYSRSQVVLEDTMPYASVYRKQLWRKVGGYDKLLSVIRQPEDWSFWISCSKHNPVVARISEKLFLYRVHPQSTYLRMIKPRRQLSKALVATCHPDLYLVRILVQAWQVIANCPDDLYQRILRAIEMCPEYGLGYFWRGLRLMKLGRIQQALEDYKIAAGRAKEGDWQGLFALMMLQKNNGDLAGAHSSLEKLLTIRPDFDWARGMLPPRVVQQKILFYYDRIGNFSKTSPGGTVMAVLNFAKALSSSNHNLEIHITGNLVYYPERYKSLHIIPLPLPHEREQFLANYDVVFFATHIRYFKNLTKPSGQIWVLCQHCWEADDLVSLSHMSDFDIVVCLSELHKAQLYDHGIGDEKLLAIPNLVDTDVYSPKDDTERNNHSIMYAGALHRHKCLDVLMDAFRLVRRQVPDAELHIYGDGNMWRGGSAYGNELKSAKPEGAYFHGYVDNKNMPQIYSRHSILCLTSRFESFGLVTVEAQACGCIPVVHNAGGVAVTLADGHTGFLYSPNTPQKLAETIIKAIRTVDSAPSIRQRAVDFVRDNFGMTRAPDYISKLWDRIAIAGAANNVRALFESGDIEQAGLECEQLLQKYPGHPDILLLQAMIMLQRKDTLKANATIRKVLEKFPKYARAMNDYGLTASKAGDIKTAVRYLTKAYKINPWDRNTNINCYTVLKESGRYAQAKTIVLNYLENVGEEARMLQLLGEIDGLAAGQGPAVNLVSQQMLDDRRTVHRRDSVSEPLVTVIMPAYNSADYISQAIESVLIQSYPKFELLIVDDGSTDNTGEIILQNKDERIKYFHKENGGPSGARNLAISKAKGQYIMPLDADDMMTPDFIARHLQEFDSHPEADLIYCDVLLIDADGNPIRVMNKPEYQDRRNLIRDLFRCGHPVIPFRLGIRRNVFDKIGLYDETLMIAEDYDMMRRFVKAGLKAHHLREALHIRRIRSDSISITANVDKAKNHFDVIRRFTDTFSCEELFPDVEWDKIPPQARQLHAKCLAAATSLALGQAYVKSKSPVYAQTAFGQARSELNDCLKMDPTNKQVRQLLRKCEFARAGSVEQV